MHVRRRIEQVEHVDDFCILHICSVTPEDAGPIRCFACTRAGEQPEGEERNGGGCEAAPHSRPADVPNNSSSSAFSDVSSLLHAVCAETELTVVSDIDQLVGDPELLSDSDCTPMEAATENENERQVSAASGVPDEPAAILRGPLDTAALVGDRVLLKAMYMGHPEPTVKWTRAVSCFSYYNPFSFTLVMNKDWFR